MDAYNATGVTRESNNSRALDMGIILFVYKRLLMLHHALLALEHNSSMVAFMLPDGLNLMPSYWYSLVISNTFPFIKNV